jgi:hypothetical protein
MVRISLDLGDQNRERIQCCYCKIDEVIREINIVLDNTQRSLYHLKFFFEELQGRDSKKLLCWRKRFRCETIGTIESPDNGFEE